MIYAFDGESLLRMMTNIHRIAAKLSAAGCLCEGEDENTSCHGNSSMC